MGIGRGASSASLSARIVNTVAAWVARVQSARIAPACNQRVPSVCLTAPSPTRCHTSSTAGAIASLTRASTALSAPSEMPAPSRSQSRTTAALARARLVLALDRRPALARRIARRRQVRIARVAAEPPHQLGDLLRERRHLPLELRDPHVLPGHVCLEFGDPRVLPRPLRLQLCDSLVAPVRRHSPLLAHPRLESRVCDPDGYRPCGCPRCGHAVLHVHGYLERHPRGELGLPGVVRIIQYVCAAAECGATWRILPRFLARHLWRAGRPSSAS